MHSPRDLKARTVDPKAGALLFEKQLLGSVTKIEKIEKEFEAVDPKKSAGMKINQDLGNALLEQIEIITHMSELTGAAPTGETAASGGLRHKTEAFEMMEKQLDSMASELLKKSKQLAASVDKLQGKMGTASQIKSYNIDIDVTKGKMRQTSLIMTWTCKELIATLKLWSGQIKAAAAAE